MAGAVTIIHPETLVRWHRQGFRSYWRRKSRPRGGRPKGPKELRDLIRQMSAQNPPWGAPRIYGELLKLGFDVSKDTPEGRSVRPDGSGKIVAFPRVGGLHHRYERLAA